MIYNTNEKPKTIKEWVLYPLQMLLAVFVATVLISVICGTPISSCLLGAGIGTLVYEIITRFRSPMFISSCGATCSAVIGALALGSGQNYLMVFIGGVLIAIIYTIFGLLVKIKGAQFIDKILPPSIVGSITIVIGVNLAKYTPTYTGNCDNWQVGIALATMFVTAISSHYFRGFMKSIAFLIGLAFGYVVSLILTVTGIATIVDFSAFSSMTWYPDLVFLKWSASDFSWTNLLTTVLLFTPVALAAICEHISDHKTLSNILGQDLTVDPGLTRTFIGDGVASAIGTGLCGLPNTSYGESIATIGFSGVGSVVVSTMTAIVIALMSFFAPLTAFIQTIPSCCFGGCALILYGYIAASGLKTLINNKVDLDNNKSLIIVSVILTVGIGGMYFLNEAFAGVSLAMILGVILNLILRENNYN